MLLEDRRLTCSCVGRSVTETLIGISEKWSCNRLQHFAQLGRVKTRTCKNFGLLWTATLLLLWTVPHPCKASKQALMRWSSSLSHQRHGNVWYPVSKSIRENQPMPWLQIQLHILCSVWAICAALSYYSQFQWMQSNWYKRLCSHLRYTNHYCKLTGEEGGGGWWLWRLQPRDANDLTCSAWYTWEFGVETGVLAEEEPLESRTHCTFQWSSLFGTNC